MDNYISPEVYDQASQVLRKTFGTSADVTSVEWTGGGLFNKVYYIGSNKGSYILKIECNDIFISTRKDQIKNEVYGSELVKKAGIPCAAVLAHNFDKNDIGARYILTERISNDILWCNWFNYTDDQKERIKQETKEILSRINSITSSYFGSVCPNGLIGRHAAWNDCFRAILKLLVGDCEKLSLLTGEELDTVNKACASLTGKSLCTYTPTFNHNDFGRHNTIWGSIGGSHESVHIIDFGNAFFGLPYIDEYFVYRSGDFDFLPCNILVEKNIELYDYEKWLFICEFEKMLWTASEKLTNDYAHCTDGLTWSIEKSKADNSRSYILEFINKCYRILCK